MSLSDDLALVTACRDALDGPLWGATNRLREVADAALSLIEDTLNRHKPMATTYVEPNGGAEIHRCDECLDDHPCSEYAPAIAALHTIATALGVET